MNILSFAYWDEFFDEDGSDGQHDNDWNNDAAFSTVELFFSDSPEMRVGEKIADLKDGKHALLIEFKTDI